MCGFGGHLRGWLGRHGRQPAATAVMPGWPSRLRLGKARRRRWLPGLIASRWSRDRDGLAALRAFDPMPRNRARQPELSAAARALHENAMIQAHDHPPYRCESSLHLASRASKVPQAIVIRKARHYKTASLLNRSSRNRAKRPVTRWPGPQSPTSSTLEPAHTAQEAVRQRQWTCTSAEPMSRSSGTPPCSIAGGHHRGGHHHRTRQPTRST